MKTTNRRHFLKTAAAGLGEALVLTNLPSQLLAAANKVKYPLGFQTWSVKDMLGKDFSGTLKTMAGQGYQQMEMCSPKGYSDPGFRQFANTKPADLRTIITDAGLSCPSCHFGFNEFSAENLDDRIEFAKGLGMGQMICSSFGLPKTATLNDYLARAEALNKAGEKIKSAGLQAGFHNHNTEFTQLDGQLIYEALLNRLDPDLVKMQFQTAVITLGYKGADYFKKYPGRFISAHLSDWTMEKKEAPVGQGVIDWKEFFAATKKGGVKNIFVEMDPSTFKDSAAYIRSL